MLTRAAQKSSTACFSGSKILTEEHANNNCTVFVRFRLLAGIKS